MIELKNEFKKKLVRTLVIVFSTTVIIIGINIITEGMYLIGIPKIENVEKVTISYPKVSNETKEIKSKKDIELAVKLTGYLKYSLFEEVDTTESPLITISYFTSDGENVSVSANQNTVWWNGKTHTLADDDTFIKMTEVIFYFKEINEMHAN